MNYLNPFSAWFETNNDQIKSDYFKETSLDNKVLKVEIMKKAKQLWRNLTPIQQNNWKNKIEIKKLPPNEIMKPKTKTKPKRQSLKRIKKDKSKHSKKQKLIRK